MTKFIILLFAWLGWAPKSAVERNPPPADCPPARVRPRIVTEAQQIRDAVDLLNRAVHGYTQPPAAMITAAWELVENLAPPLAGLLHACTHLGHSWPPCPRGTDPDRWLTTTLDTVSREIQTVVTAIRAGVRMNTWRAVENVMARDVEHQLRGSKPTVIYADGPEARREVHLRDSVRSDDHPAGRVIVARLYEHGAGGQLEIVSPGGGEIAKDTVQRSRWSICAGWISVTGPGGGRRQAIGDGAPREEYTPPTKRP